MTHYVYGTALETRFVQPVIDVSAKYKPIPATFPAEELLSG
jgi:hypothetical protein